jgi:thiol-disulfide isomerase/thioredoxin
MDLGAKFEAGLSYEVFLAKYGTDEQRSRWAKFHAAVKLKPAQVELLKSFTREMKVIVLAGAWCGDCVNQCPIFDYFAQATSTIQLRFFDRDDNRDLAERLSVCGGARVPAVLFVSEDNFACGQYGDRTLSKYRKVVGELTGAACPTGIVLPGQSEIDDVIQDWLNEFERVQWILRTSGRLRKLHND